MSKLRLTVLVSGGGTNLQAIIDAIASGDITNAEIVGVISNNPGVYSLERAANAGIPAFVISPRTFDTRADFNIALKNKIDELVNIHPALIPAFCGKGYYGLKVHEAALKRGVKLSGATVHFVNKDLDAGPIILQKAVEVKEGDTPKELQQRIMEQAEWKIMPKAIDLIANGKITVVDGHVIIKD